MGGLVVLVVSNMCGRAHTAQSQGLQHCVRLGPLIGPCLKVVGAKNISITLSKWQIALVLLKLDLSCFYTFKSDTTSTLASLDAKQSHSSVLCTRLSNGDGENQT